MRSRDSFTAESGRPTISKPGKPDERKHSAVTAKPETPERPSELIFDIIKSHLFKSGIIPVVPKII